MNLLRTLALAGAALVATFALSAAPLPSLKVSDNQRFLVTADGKPFFWLGDTAWELFHRCNREEAVAYLDLRQKQRYNVVQAVALAELEGLVDPNPYGDLPLTDRDPAKPATTPGADPKNAAAYDYWDHVDFIVDEANRRGIYIALLPTWGAWAPHDKKTDPKFVFTERNAATFGEFLGKRYRDKSIIWVMGGDRSPDGVEGIWRAMARGVALGVTGREDYSGLLMTFHPRGGATSSTWFHADAWLDFNMQQTGHGPVPTAPNTKPGWLRIDDDYRRTPTKPVLDGEPLYEDHPIGFRAAKENGYSFDAHIRQRAYWHVFAGAFGHTYGHHSVWQMYSAGKKPINGPLVYWTEAIHRPGAAQMQHLRTLIESRPFFTRVPDQSLIVDPLKGADYIAGTRGDDYAFIYSAQGRPFTVTLGKISGARVNAMWFNPRNGASEKIGTFDNNGTREFTPHVHGGFGTDMVLVLDDASKNYSAPGAKN
jgi:hypothetical protein